MGLSLVLSSGLVQRSKPQQGSAAAAEAAARAAAQHLPLAARPPAGPGHAGPRGLRGAPAGTRSGGGRRPLVPTVRAHSPRPPVGSSIPLRQAPPTLLLPPSERKIKHGIKRSSSQKQIRASNSEAGVSCAHVHTPALRRPKELCQHERRCGRPAAPSVTAPGSAEPAACTAPPQHHLAFRCQIPAGMALQTVEHHHQVICCTYIYRRCLADVDERGAETNGT